MADKKRLLDVWIVEINQVYREVPFSVVTDWLQQGRLLAEDRVRLAGGTQWHVVDKVPGLVPFLPKAEPLAAEDRAEALEPVDLGFAPTRRVEDEDEDVDMIPLIDISLVLLIFFMMTATVSSGFLSTINTPGAKHQLATPASDSWWVGIDSKSGGGQVEKGPDGTPLPWYSFGRESQELHAPATNVAGLLEALGKAIVASEGDVQVRLRADRGLPIETIKGITLELQGLEGRLNQGRDKGKLRFTITGEVSEPQDG
jgi:hypothetical protein